MSKMGGKDCKICLKYLLTEPQALVSTKKIGLSDLVTRKCVDCLIKTVIASTNIITSVMH